MRRIYLAAMLLLLTPGSAWAQQHPCDVVPPTEYQLVPNEMVRLGFCHSGVDGGGQAVTEFQLVTTTGNQSIGLPPVIGSPNAAGLKYYETAEFAATQAGSFSVRAVAPGGVSIPSSTITVAFVTLPVAPVGFRITRRP